MPTKRRLLSGRKVSDSHSTVIKEAGPIVSRAKSLGEVRKIVIDQIVPLGQGEKRIRFAPVLAGMRIVVRGASAQQTLYVYTGDVGKTTRDLKNAWSRKILKEKA